MGQSLEGRKVAFLATDGVEQVESSEIQGFNHLDKGDTFKVDRTVDDASEGDYDRLVLPGGVANPDFLRMNENAVSFARSFFEAGKPVAVICPRDGGGDLRGQARRPDRRRHALSADLRRPRPSTSGVQRVSPN